MSADRYVLISSALFSVPYEGTSTTDLAIVSSNSKEELFETAYQQYIESTSGCVCSGWITDGSVPDLTEPNSYGQVRYVIPFIPLRFAELIDAMVSGEGDHVGNVYSTRSRIYDTLEKSEELLGDDKLGIRFAAELRSHPERFSHWYALSWRDQDDTRVYDPWTREMV